VSSTPTVLTATSRTETGKAVAHLRKAGKVPAVVFGHGLESISVTLDAHEFDLLRRTIHSNSIISLEIDGKDKRRVMVHGIHIDPRTRHLLHVDLFASSRARRSRLKSRYTPSARPTRRPSSAAPSCTPWTGFASEPCPRPCPRRSRSRSSRWSTSTPPSICATSPCLRRDPAGRSGRSRGQGDPAARGRGAGGCRVAPEAAEVAPEAAEAKPSSES